MEFIKENLLVLIPKLKCAVTDYNTAQEYYNWA